MDFGDFFDGVGGGHGGSFDWFSDLFGEARGASFFDRLGGGGIFDDIHGARASSAFEDILGSSGRAARGESIFARMAHYAAEAFDRYLDVEILRDIHHRRHGNGFGFNWTNVSDEEKLGVAAIRDVLKGHAFIANQLNRFPELTEMAHTYEQLGMRLPDAEQLTKAYRSLSSRLHPDKSPTNSALMSQLNAARDALNDTAKVKSYHEALETSPHMLRDLFVKASNTKWDQTFDKISSKSRLRIGGPARPPEQGFGKWAHELSPAGKSGLIIGAVVLAGLGVYGLARGRENSNKHSEKQPSPAVQGGKHTSTTTLSKEASALRTAS